MAKSFEKLCRELNESSEEVSTVPFQAGEISINEYEPENWHQLSDPRYFAKFEAYVESFNATPVTDPFTTLKNFALQLLKYGFDLEDFAKISETMTGAVAKESFHVMLDGGNINLDTMEKDDGISKQIGKSLMLDFGWRKTKTGKFKITTELRKVGPKTVDVVTNKVKPFAKPAKVKGDPNIVKESIETPHIPSEDEINKMPQDAKKMYLFAKKYPGLHSYKKDVPTKKAVQWLVNRGYIKSNQYDQFYIIGTENKGIKEAVEPDDEPVVVIFRKHDNGDCLLYTSDAADE